MNPEMHEDDGVSNTDDDEKDADNDPKSQPSDSAAQLETGKRSGEEATAAQLVKAGENLGGCQADSQQGEGQG